MMKQIVETIVKASEAAEQTMLPTLANKAYPNVCTGKTVAIKIPDIQKMKVKFEKTGTAEVIAGRHFGVALKDEGDFISVRFGSKELTDISSVPTAEWNFREKIEAFAFAKEIQNYVREILGQCCLEIHRN
jgi:hypothetical protein